MYDVMCWKKGKPTCMYSCPYILNVTFLNVYVERFLFLYVFGQAGVAGVKRRKILLKDLFFNLK
jgi:hypothetical protein